MYFVTNSSSTSFVVVSKKGKEFHADLKFRIGEKVWRSVGVQVRGRRAEKRAGDPVLHSSL
jgi:hypothetical protein